LGAINYGFQLGEGSPLAAWAEPQDLQKCVKTVRRTWQTLQF